jgi:hypothetical protein
LTDLFTFCPSIRAGYLGPAEVEERIAPADGWHNPVMTPPTAVDAEVRAA